MTGATGSLLRGAFFLLSRTTTWLYRRFPLFGRLRGSIAIIRNSGQYLVIERSDRLGMCFPGGRARPGESDESALEREVREETGLTVTSCRFLFSFEEPIACTQVFEAEAVGTLKGSWEGEPRWVSLSELRRRVYGQHRPVLAFLDQSA